MSVRLHNTTDHHPAQQRGFALPLVVLLTLVGGLAIALLLQRHGVQSLAYQRQVENYTNHHEASGVMECILAWLPTARGKIENAVDENGLAFSMDLSGGSSQSNAARIDVYMREGQGSMLRDPSAVFGRKREIVEDSVYVLDTMPEELKVEGLFRTVGPPEISLKSAPAIAIQAICTAVIEDPKKADEAAREILRTRDEMLAESSGGVGGGVGGVGGVAVDPSPTLVTNAIQDLGLTAQEQKEITAMLTVKPTLYECVAETFDRSNRLLARSGGYYLVTDVAQNQAIKQRGAFLSWEQKPLERTDEALNR